MASQVDDPYVSEYPPECNISLDIRNLIRHYYTVVDTRGKHTEYARCWAEDGVLIAHGKTFRGHHELSNVHSGMWGDIKKRIHRPLKIFPFGNNANEVVIIGTVEYWLESGQYVERDMAARAKYQAATGGGVEMSSLQVWLSA